MKKSKSVYDLVLRYFILILAAIPNLWLFYTIFTPLTSYPVHFLLGIFYDTTILNNNIILINKMIPIELIDACIAGSAYYLLLILNLSTPNIKIKKRMKILLAAFSFFLIINILRIFALSLVAVSGSSFFDITHRIFWYALSTVFVVAIWFAEVKIFKIKDIPFFSDIKFMYNQTK